MVSYTAISVAALGASIVLLSHTIARSYALAAVAIAGLQVAMALGWLRLAIAGVPLAMGLSIALALAGALTWNRCNSKMSVTAATVVTACGVLQVLARLRVL